MVTRNIVAGYHAIDWILWQRQSFPDNPCHIQSVFGWRF